MTNRSEAISAARHSQACGALGPVGIKRGRLAFAANAVCSLLEGVRSRRFGLRLPYQCKVNGPRRHLRQTEDGPRPSINSSWPD